MKAAIYTEYGSPNVVSVKEVPIPPLKDNEVRIQVHATTVTSADSRIRAMRIPAGFKLLSRLMFGILKPRKHILGSEFAGIVDAVGANVSEFNVGDSVFGAFDEGGTHAEYFVMPADGPIAPMPTGFSFGEIASLPFGAITSLVFLRDMGKIQSGQKILIIGASGALGTAGVQLASHWGAEVTGVCSTQNLELVRSIGASHVIDYTTTDFTQSGEMYDIVYETVGKASFEQCKRALKPGGTCLMAVASVPDYFRMLANPIAGDKKLVSGVAFAKKETVSDLKALIDKGAIRAVIDTTYPLERIAEAHALVDSGHKKGSVVIQMPNAEQPVRA